MLKRCFLAILNSTLSALAHLRTIGRVASYQKFQPSGSAVNNSNTAAMALGALERFAANTAVAKVPILRVLASFAADQARNQSNKATGAAVFSPRFTPPPQLPSAYPSPAPLAVPALIGAGGQE